MPRLRFALSGTRPNLLAMQVEFPRDETLRHICQALTRCEPQAAERLEQSLHGKLDDDDVVQLAKYGDELDLNRSLHGAIRIARLILFANKPARLDWFVGKAASSFTDSELPVDVLRVVEGIARDEDAIDILAPLVNNKPQVDSLIRACGSRALPMLDRIAASPAQRPAKKAKKLAASIRKAAG